MAEYLVVYEWFERNGGRGISNTFCTTGGRPTKVTIKNLIRELKSRGRYAEVAITNIIPLAAEDEMEAEYEKEKEPAHQS